MKRRGLLLGLLALPFAPQVAQAALRALESMPSRSYPFYGNISDIIASTIEGRPRQIADNVSKDNALLKMLRKS